MSWDGVMMRFPGNVRLSEMPNDWKVPAIGTQSELREQLERIFPGQHHVDGQSCLEGDSFWIEINYNVRNKNGSIESIFIRSNAGPGAMAQLKRACEMLDLQLVDCQTGEFADFAIETDASMKDFTAWRGRAIRQSADEHDGTT